MLFVLFCLFCWWAFIMWYISMEPWRGLVLLWLTGISGAVFMDMEKAQKCLNFTQIPKSFYIQTNMHHSMLTEFMNSHLFVFLSFSFSKLEDKRLTCRLTEPCWHSFLDITWHENSINNNTKACISGFYGMYFFIPYLLIYLILFCFLYLFFYSFNCWPLILILLLHLVLKFLCINT